MVKFSLISIIILSQSIKYYNSFGKRLLLIFKAHGVIMYV